MATTLTLSNEIYEPSGWENVACPFCGSSIKTPYECFGYKLKFTYVRCLDCTLVYQTPRPIYDNQFVNVAYENYVPDLNNVYFNDNGLLPDGKELADRATKLIEEIELFAPLRGRLLDIGCHVGLLCKSASERGWKSTGIDISNAMVQTAIKRFGVDARVGDWTQMSFEGLFDAIICNHVLEHIPNPTYWLTKMKSILAPGGVICLSFPNIDSLENRFKHQMNMIGLKKLSEWEPWRTPDHLCEPNEASFLRLIQGLGLKVVQVQTYSNKEGGSDGWLKKTYHQKFRLGTKLRFLLTSEDNR